MIVRFTERQIAEALSHAASGGQALHLHRILVPGAPRCFVAAVNRGEDIAHLLDQNPQRLYGTAKALGVKVVVIENAGSRRQHVDLCGKPLRLAVSMSIPSEGGLKS